MKEIMLDSGVQEYRIGGGVLRFNPGDPNLYHRFLEAAEKIEAMQDTLAQLTAQAADSKALMELVTMTDRRAKQLLDEAFGGGCDFDAVLEGVNLLAVCQNGQRAVTNLLTALQPVLEEGAKRFYEEAAAPELAAAAARHGND